VTEGYPVIAPGQRGGVDTKASADTGVIDLTGEWRASDETSLRLNGRWFHEERGNGTPYTGNETTGEDGSLTFTRKLPDLGDLQLSVYGQNRKFSSTFSSVKPDRNSETPALNQYDVPADAVGGSLVWGMSAGAHRLTLGSDFRYVDGQTNEMFFWNGKAFTRLRRAGGEELFEGVFLQDTWTVSDKAIVVGGLRWDHWDLLNGFRKETDIATGHIRTDSHFPDRNDQEINGRLGLRYNLCDGLMARAAGYSGFRVPTLNELYRPFRVGNDVTEANPALNPEHLLGGEVSLEWQASRTFSISGTGFVNQMEDAISNVTIGIGPGTFNPGGFIPAGGVLRQRQNIDLVVAPGFEGTATWELYKDLQFKGSYLFTHPAIERAADPKLRGNLLAQTPEHVVTLGLEWHPLARWMFIGQMRYCARQFEDDQNSRVLAPCTTVDTAVSYQFSRHASAALRVENLLDQEIETGVSADNIRSIGAPRLVTLTVRWQL
jgi:outer membrane receptor protein involved in Fe transport